MPDTCEIVRENCLSYIGDRMDYMKSKKIKTYNEESITDEIIYRIDVGGCSDSKIFHAKKESETGADIEWWLVDKKFRKAIAFRIQAKKLYSEGVYEGINRNIGIPSKTGKERKRKQIKALISTSIKDRMIPLYCFYNYRGGIDSRKLNKEYCWTFAIANYIRDLINKKSGLPLEDTPKDIKLSPSEINPMKSILELICNVNSNYLSNITIEPFVDLEKGSFYRKKLLNYKDFIRDESEIPKDIQDYLIRNQIDDYNQLYRLPKYLIITERDNVIDPKIF